MSGKQMRSGTFLDNSCEMFHKFWTSADSCYDLSKVESSTAYQTCILKTPLVGMCHSLPYIYMHHCAWQVFFPGVPVYHCIPNSWRGNSLGMRLTAVIAVGCSLRQRSVNIAFSWIKHYQTLCCVCLTVFQLKVRTTHISVWGGKKSYQNVTNLTLRC